MLIQMSRATPEEQASYYRALSLDKGTPTVDKSKEKVDKGPKVKNRDQLGGFLGDLVRAESIMIDGEEIVFESADVREAVDAAIRWARGEIKAYPLILPPGDKSDRKRDA